MMHERIKCHYLEFILDFHHDRDYLVNHLFAFHPAMTRYLSARYGHLLNGERESVSVHFRIDSDNEVLPLNLLSRGAPSLSWYESVMEHEFDIKSVVFLVFCENSTAIQPLFDKLQRKHPVFRFEMIEENFALSLALTSMCKHHVLAVSTFSFWG
jgi:hypothetical protein